MKKIAVLLLILLALPISMRAQGWKVDCKYVQACSLKTVIDSLVERHHEKEPDLRVFYLDTAYDKGFVKDSFQVYVDPNYEIHPGWWTCMMGYYDWQYYYRAVIDTVWVTKPGKYQIDKPED